MVLQIPQILRNPALILLNQDRERYWFPSRRTLVLGNVFPRHIKPDIDIFSDRKRLYQSFLSSRRAESHNSRQILHAEDTCSTPTQNFRLRSDLRGRNQDVKGEDKCEVLFGNNFGSQNDIGIEFALEFLTRSYPILTAMHVGNERTQNGTAADRRYSTS